MFLKRLDIVGFKSFAEKIMVDFVPGVTAVVGPNGSGKSNITDAIRWVLGEQSAKSLRGAKMEDVIFAGSDSRKALNFAEVTLTLDNEDQLLPLDYSEICVTRRVYRSGESEFSINNQSCRLKDITDLFMDSGLGKNAFSIISQGRVEEILNSKAEERRTIFEEAAGVLKYKTRKKKAESKLAETEGNLNRVNDIIFELENQIEPLKVQASITKDYLQQKEELEKLEIALTVFTIEDLHAKWVKISHDLDIYKKKEKQYTADIQEKETKLAELRDQASALDDSINDLQNVLLYVSEELEKLEGRKQVLIERKKNASQNKDLLQQNFEECTAKVKNLSVQKTKQYSIFQELASNAKKLQHEIKDKQEHLKLFNENIEEKIESLKSDYIELLNKHAASKNELQNINQQLSQQEQRTLKLEGENQNSIQNRQRIAEKKEKIQATLKLTQKELDEHVRLLRAEQKKLETVKNNYQRQEENLYQAYKYLQKAKSRQEMLEEMEGEFSGFFQGVKEVLKARNSHLHGIEGAVAELIQVPRQYETAIETALGGAMQHIIVKSEQEARNAIQYLKKNSFGRATFLPLTIVKGKSLSPNQLQLIQSHPSFVGEAVNLIQAHKKYNEVLRNLLGNVIIASNLKGANEMSKILQYRVRFVTLEGDIVNPGGSMTGGALKQKHSSILSRKTELEELKAKMSDMELKTDNCQKQVQTLKSEIKQMENYIDKLRKIGEDLRLKLQAVKGDLREAEFEERNLNDKLSLYDLEKVQFIEDREKLQARKSELSTLIEGFQSRITSLDQEISSLIEKKNNQQISKDALLIEINELKVRYAAISEQLTYEKGKYEEIAAELLASKEKLVVIKEDLDLLSSEMNNNFSGEQRLEETAKEKLQDKKQTIELISIRRNERLKLQAILTELEHDIKELKYQQREAAVTLKDKEVKVNRLDVELESNLSNLREEYQLSFEAAKQAFPLAMPVEDARRKIKLLKLAIEEMGNVNLGAIDEYERVSERYRFLLEQKNDLQEAKDTLFQVIDEMDTEMKKRFEETFKGIRLQFNTVFQSLFGGGRADLRLTDPDDLLNTGIEIVAQPPGKKLQNLALLSGGERALTAIALLFSILKVRPVPFCILDEVEAALDEANVYRFSQYLKRYSTETQFIVITHRKGTMEEADVLYGVTMQESGVSKLVSVRFEETSHLVSQ